MSDNRNIKQFLPAPFRNDKVDNFLDTTTETLFTKKESTKINQFIGKTVGGIYDPLKDNYVNEIRKIREDYQLEPSLVTRDKETTEINNVFAYEDMLNSLKYSGSDTHDHNRLFECKAYSFAPPIDVDMFINPNDYYWYPEGVPSIPVDALPEDIIGKVSYVGFVNGDESDPIRLTSGNHIKLNDGCVYIVDGVGKYIQLFEFDQYNNKPLMLPFLNNPNIEDVLEKYPFEYITMQRGSYDNNIWSRHNAWYHKDSLVIRTKALTFRPDNSRRAKRPIICFNRNIELFNYGVYKTYVDYKVDTLNTTGLQINDKIIINNDNNVYQFNGTTFDVVLTLNHGEMVTVVNGDFYKKEFRWDTLIQDYILCQEKNKPNDFIKFNLYDSKTEASATLINDEILYPESNFNGCEIFGYKEDNLYGIYDNVLDMNISYQNQTYDSGNIVYKNYLTDVYTYIIDGMEHKHQTVYYKQFNPEKLPDNNIIKFTIGPNNDINKSKRTSIYINGEDSATIVLRADVPYIFDFSDTTTTDRSWNGEYTRISVKNKHTGEIIIKPTHSDNKINKHSVKFDFNHGGEDLNLYEYTDGINTGNIVIIEDIEEVVNFHNVWKDIGVIKTQLYSSKVVVDNLTDGFLELSMYPENDNFNFTINGIQQDKKSYSFNKKVITPNIKLSKGDFLECRYTTNHKITTAIVDVQEIHPSLSNNTWNETPIEMAYGDIFQHMLSIINNQDNLIGNALSTNNYRDTLKDISKGNVIIQTETPLSLSMYSLFDDRRMPIDAIDIAEKSYENYKLALMSQTEIYLATNNITLENVALSFDNIVQEINIGKNNDMSYSTSYMFATYNKYVIINTDDNNYTDLFLDIESNNNAFYIYTTNGIAVIDVDYTVESDYSLMTSKIILKTISPENIIEMRYYEDMEPVFCPPTPTKFGMTKPHYPEIVINDTYSNIQYFIKGHDGSLTPCFSTIEEIEQNKLSGIDLILIEFERRVYNNILQMFKQPDINIIDITATRPGKFRNTKYSIDEYNTMLFKYFNNWVFSNDVEYRKNTSYNSKDPFTFNYSSLVDNDGIRLQGNWRGIFLYYYDTTTPHTTPWEMLGFNIKPDWWDIEYTDDYSSNNKNMWNDIEEGIIRHGERMNVNFKQYLINNPYRRIGLSNILPVDSDGKIKNPIQAGICGTPEYHNSISDWKFGDCSPVEFSWRNTSNFDFTQMKVYFNMFPSDFIIKSWNTEKTFSMYPDNVVDVRTLGIHSTTRYIPGLSQWLYETLIQNHYNTDAVLTDTYNNLNIQLSHKVGGFVDTSELQILIESYSPNSVNSSAIIPHEDITTRIYESKEINQFEYSGVVITRVRPFDEFYTYKTGYNYYKDDVVYIESEKTYYKNISNIRHVDWEFSTFYVVGRIVVFNGYLYECIEDHRADKSNIPELLTKWKLRDFSSSEWKVIDGKPAPKNTYFKVLGYSSNIPYFLTIPAKNGSKRKNIVAYSEKSKPQFIKPYIANEKVYSGEYRKTEDNKIIISKSDIVTGDSKNPDMTYWISTTEIPYTHVSRFSYPIEGDLDKIVPIEYGHVFKTEQDLIDFLAAYSRYLEHVGFKFDEYNSERKMYNDWHLSIKEFLEWSIDNKNENTTIVLSPSESVIKFNPKHGVVTTIKDVDNGVFNVRTYDGSGMPKELLHVTRNNDIYNLKAELPIYYAKLSVREYEHIISVNNVTIFNDIIYNPLYNLRKDRLLLRVEKSNFWDGKLRADGFIINNNTLLPNFETSVDELRSLIDVDSISTQEVFNVLKYHNIGYQNREHLREIGMTDVAQIKFYQGFIKQKGTNSAYQSILRNKVVGADQEMYVTEDWAFKEAEFGAVSNNQSIEIMLRNEDIKDTPQPVVLEYKRIFEDKKPSYVYTAYDNRSKWISAPTKFFNDTDIFPTDQLEKLKVFETAGYVIWDEVNIRSFDLYNIDNNMSNIRGNKNNQTVWICDDSNSHNSWNVYKIKNITPPFNVASISSFGEKGKNSTLIVFDKIVNDDSIYAMYDGVVDKTFKIQHVRDKCHILLPFDDDFVLLPDTFTPSDFQFSKFYSMRINKYINTIYSTLEETIDKFIVDTMLEVEPGDILYVDDNSNGRWVVVKFNGVSWDVIREEEDVININNFEKSLAYDTKKNNVIETFKYYDPIKGFIPGAHLDLIDFKTEYDPVEYNGEEYSNFTKQYLSKLWLDTSKFRYIEYEQQSIEYRIRFWGTLFPGSQINVYEWTRGLIEPSKLPIDEQMKLYDVNRYIIDKEYDVSLGIERVYYYYWVKNPITPPVNNRRSISASEVANSIRHPSSNIQEACAIISNECFTIYDYAKTLLERECIVQINYRIADMDSEKHKQWVLVSESPDNLRIPQLVFDKLIDSVIGFTEPDINGVMVEVPDPKLPEILKYGNSNQPMQSWFKDQQGARKIFLERMNAYLQHINLWDVDLFWERATDNFPRYTTIFGLVDWYDTDYNKDRPIKYVVGDRSEIITTPSAYGEYIKVAEKVGSKPSVYEPGWTIYERVKEGETFKKVAQSKSAMRLNDRLYEVEKLSNKEAIEFRQLINLLLDTIFKKPYHTEINNILFALVRFVFNDQRSNSWVFPTTYISINQTLEMFIQSPVYLQDKDSQLLSYIEEAKPYHTKVRMFNKFYKGLDYGGFYVTDFDKKPYVTLENRDVVNLQEDIIDKVTSDGVSRNFMLTKVHDQNRSRVFIDGEEIAKTNYSIALDRITFTFIPEKPRNHVKNIVVITPNDNDIMLLNNDTQYRGYLEVNKNKPQDWNNTVRENYMRVVYDRISIIPSMNLELLKQRYDDILLQEEPQKAFSNEIFDKFDSVGKFTQADRLTTRLHYQLLADIVNTSETYTIPDNVSNTITFNIDLERDNLRVFIDECLINKNYYKVIKPATGGTKIKFNMTLYSGQHIILRNKTNYDLLIRKLSHYKDFSIEKFIERLVGVDWVSKEDKLVYLDADGNLIVDKDFEDELKRAKHNLEFINTDSKFTDENVTPLNGGAFMNASERGVPEEYTGFEINECTVISAINTYPVMEEGYDTIQGNEIYQSLSLSGDNVTVIFDINEVNVPDEQLLVIVNDDEWVLNKHYTIDRDNNKIIFIKVPPTGVDNIIITDRIGGFDSYNDRVLDKFYDDHKSGYGGLRSPLNVEPPIREYIIYSNDGRQYFFKCAESNSAVSATTITDDMRTIPVSNITDKNTKGLAAIHGTEYVCIDGKRNVKSSSIEFVYYDKIINNTLHGVYRGLFGTHARTFDINTFDIKVYPLDVEDTMNTMTIDEPYIGIKNIPNYPKYGHIFFGKSDIEQC